MRTFDRPERSRELIRGIYRKLAHRRGGDRGQLVPPSSEHLPDGGRSRDERGGPQSARTRLSQSVPLRVGSLRNRRGDAAGLTISALAHRLADHLASRLGDLAVRIRWRDRRRDEIGIMLRHYDQHGGGVKVYTENLLRNLLPMASKHEIVLL